MNIQTPALHYVCEQPPEPFEEEFPLVAEYYLFRAQALDEAHGTEWNLTAVYIPEDDQLLQKEAALQFIMQMAPIATFSGAVSITVTIPEES